MIAIIDYGAGNIQSVKNALDFLKVKNKITDKADDIKKANKIIFPGARADTTLSTIFLLPYPINTLMLFK